MTRSNPTELVEFNPEIEASARRAQGQIRREKKKQKEQSNSERTADSTNEESTDSTNHPNDPTPPIEVPRAPMAEQTIRQLAAAPAVQQPLCITFPQGETPFQLKTGLIHLLPTFHGLPSESPHRHLNEFHLVCSSMKPQGVSEDQIKLRAFPFSLSGLAKEWLFYLPPNSVTTWTELNNKFLDRFFPAAKASEIRRSILGIKQKHEESLHEYWERYKKLCASCPQHGLGDQTLIQYFYEGLLPMEMKMIDAASGGALCNMTPTQAKDLISTMAANSQQFSAISEPNQRVHEVSIVSLEKKFEQFTDMVASMLADKKQLFRPCGICTSTDHPTDGCPSLQDETVNAVGNFPGPPQKSYNPYSNTFNPGWRDHPNLSYAPNSRPNSSYPTKVSQPFQQPQKSSLELMVENLAINQGKIQEQMTQCQNQMTQCQNQMTQCQNQMTQSQNQFQNQMTQFQNQISQSQKRTDSRIQDVEKQVSHLAQTMSRIDSQFQGKLPSQTEPNPKANVSAITLRSGTVIEPPVQPQKEKESNAGSQKDDKTETEPSPYAEPPPFPTRFLKKDKQAEEKDILDIFRKVELNIPLLEVIRKIPRYARFLKDLCTNKRKLMGHEKINLGANVSAILTRRLPPKLKDQGMFTIPCKIGKVGFKKAMCDLGASINVMPLSVYKTLSADPLKETRITVQLADRSTIYPEGILENVLVQVNELIFPADFYVIDMKSDRTNNSPEILLGRPFLGTANVKIEVRSGLLTLECNGEVVKFNVYKEMRHPEDIQCVNFVGVFEPAVDEFIETNFINELCREIEDFEEEIRKFEKSFSINYDLCSIPSESKILHSVLQEPKIEWKLPPKQLSKGYTLSTINSKLQKIHNRTYNGHRLSLKEILSWSKRKKRKKFLLRCL
ncbi:hypothetical protein GQ457_16G009050 [Hibiscus cannabinus]